MEFWKRKIAILQKTMPYDSNPRKNANKEEPTIHFTNTLITIANKTIPKT